MSRTPRPRPAGLHRLPAGLNRRALLSAGLGLAMAVSLAACGGDSSSPGSSGSGGGTGTVKWAWQLPTTWDPVTSSAGSDVQMLALTYSSLTHIDDQGNAVPNLVESWKYNDDGTAVTFKLKDGLVFSDGSPLDAEAVKKSLERGRDAENSLIAAQLVDLKDVTVDDDLTFTLKLAGANYQYPNLLAGKTGMVVNPAVFEKDADSLATKPAGSGPFVLDSYTQNASAKLTRNPKYFEADDIKVSSFELYPAADAATVVASLQSGQYNVGLLPGSQVEAAKAAGLEVQEIPSLYVATLDVNKTMAPFDDPKVVEALHYAVDRQQLVDAGQFGVGEVNYSPSRPATSATTRS
jgi:peptide/nickel transport system substrate-binding protein